uniref:Uncharacterized protein n=1 Tax=Lepeophtheirus salmonis TaxID=72036 RepID=A0A0K2UGK0_LEPSM
MLNYSTNAIETFTRLDLKRTIEGRVMKMCILELNYHSAPGTGFQCNYSTVSRTNRWNYFRIRLFRWK